MTQTPNEIFVILVLYNVKLADSETYKSILSNNKYVTLSGIVYDNSEIAQDISGIDLLGQFEYIHNANNPGLAVAYNHALDVALKNSYSWILLLDQDTFFPETYFQNLREIDFNADSSIVAYAPIVKAFSNRKVLISPAKTEKGGFAPFYDFKIGKQHEKVSGINSGTILNCQFMKSIGGFNLSYALDMLDHWYFREIYKQGKYISLLEGVIFQNLSVSDNLEKNMSLNRYKNFVEVELKFFKSDSIKQYCFYKLRLFFRVIKQMRFMNKEYYRLTLKKCFHFDW